ncbi:MAG: glycoside hydrolase family 127 protein [Acidobacteriaceae bacterium]|nr:glycoside hydrolase family 127 protein [Acidobacteriaceae bacterium]
MKFMLAKGEQMVADLAKCQQKLSGGYLSAFPTEWLDRLDARQPVWAPFYTIHKFMASMIDQ